MRLTIRSFSANDVGTYHCVSTNSLGRAEGTLRLYGKKKETNSLKILQSNFILNLFLFTQKLKSIQAHQNRMVIN